MYKDVKSYYVHMTKFLQWAGKFSDFTYSLIHKFLYSIRQA